MGAHNRVWGTVKSYLGHECCSQGCLPYYISAWLSTWVLKFVFTYKGYRVCLKCYTVCRNKNQSEMLCSQDQHTQSGLAELVYQGATVPAAEYRTPRILTETTAATSAKSWLISASVSWFPQLLLQSLGWLMEPEFQASGGKGVSCLQLPEWVWCSRSVCPTLATPWAVACQAPLSMGFLRQGYWSGLLFPSLTGSFLPRNQTRPGLPNCRHILYLPTELQGWALTQRWEIWVLDRRKEW